MSTAAELPDPATIERSLLAMWNALLGGAAVGVDDDFFERGGSSMAAVRMLTRVIEMWGAEIDLDRFFHEPTVRTLTTLLTSA